MKNDITTKTKDFFSKILTEQAPELREAQKSKIITELSTFSVSLCRESVNGFSVDYTSAVYQLEAHKKMFLDHIDSLSITTKRLLKELEDKGVISYTMHPKTGARMVKSSSSVVYSMCEFLNSLNEFVTLFYKDVYKIEDAKEKIITQTTLF